MATTTKPARGRSVRALLASADAAAEVRRLAAKGEPILHALDAVSERAGIRWGSSAFDSLAACCGLHYNRQLDLYLTPAEERDWCR
jgi:hypothetical protein